ncbi:MAG TPA: hypothetical protein VFS01_07550 [Rhizomicrobium sp.]|jgi:hypothetical protein|nr:hypothetical protein [Rhizomicrobium sp.]
MRAGTLVAAVAVVFAGLCVPQAAQAGTREDVLAGAIRCGGVAQDHDWLDCYYGAAQPMRASLGLAPVPQSQLNLLRGAGQGGVINGARQDVLSLAIRCSGIAQDRAWLTCYYGAAQPMRVHLGLAPAGQVPVPPPRQRAAPAPARMAAPTAQPARMPPAPGLFEGIFGGKKTVVEKSRMASYSVGKDGFFIAVLANGEVWRQTSGVPDARWTHDRTMRTVEITRGVLRSFNFRVEGDPTLYKVQRVR